MSIYDIVLFNILHYVFQYIAIYYHFIRACSSWRNDHAHDRASLPWQHGHAVGSTDPLTARRTWV